MNSKLSNFFSSSLWVGRLLYCSGLREKRGYGIVDGNVIIVFLFVVCVFIVLVSGFIFLLFYVFLFFWFWVVVLFFFLVFCEFEWGGLMVLRGIVLVVWGIMLVVRGSVLVCRVVIYGGWIRFVEVWVGVVVCLSVGMLGVFYWYCNIFFCYC